MSVRLCSRRGCSNCMCDRYSPQFGYICEEDFEELVTLGPKVVVETFLDSIRQPNTREASFAYYDKIFPRD